MKSNFRSLFLAVIITTLCGAFSGPAFAETYYVSPNNSSNSNPGTLSAPWRSLVYAESQLSSGDTLILRGGTYKDVVTINVPNVTFKNYPGETPVIDGGFVRPTDPSAHPEEFPSPASWRALISITADKVTIDGLTIKRSTGKAINCERTNYSMIKNCDVSYTYASGIKIGAIGYGHNTIDNCTVIFGNYNRDVSIGVQWNTIGKVVSLQGDHNTIKNSKVAYGSCAGIEGYKDRYSIIENNIVFGNGLTQIHQAMSAYATVRNNLIYGTLRPGVSNKYGYGTGIDFACELWYDGAKWDVGHVAYGNRIANVQIGINLGYNVGKNSSYPNNTIGNVLIYNNTIIEPYSADPKREAYRTNAITISDDHLGIGNIVKNNIFWQSNGTIARGYVNASKIDMGFNLWLKAPSSSFSSSTDSTYPDYKALNISDYFVKTSSWNSISADSLDGHEFNLRPEALFAIDKGTSTPVSGPATEFLRLEKSSSLLTGNLSYVSQDDNGKWDIGAAVYVGSSPGSSVVLSAPVLEIVNKAEN